MKADRRDFLKVMTSCAFAATLVPLLGASAENKQDQGADETSVLSRPEKALSLMQKYGSCCTGVLAAFAPELGMEEELAAGLGRGMAGGVGSMGKVCGAVSGATMVIGAKMTNKDNINDMEAGMKIMDTVKEFAAKFEEQHSSIICRELIGRDISTPEKRQAAMEAKAYANCPKYVQTAAAIVDEMLGADKS
jgi:C_GCAxxG_C_C family probable redox protein